MRSLQTDAPLGEAPVGSKTEILRLTPHPVAFLPLYARWSYLLLLGYVGLRFHGVLATKLGILGGDWPMTALWAGLLLAPFVYLALRETRMTWLTFTLLLTLLAVVLQLRNQGHPFYPILALAGLAGLVSVEFVRRIHAYVIHTDRIVIDSLDGGVDMLYSDIDLVLVEQSFLGRLAGFGTVVPVTKAGTGLAQVSSTGGAIAGSGSPFGLLGLHGQASRTSVVADGGSPYVLFGVRDPGTVRDVISRQRALRSKEGSGTP